MTRIMIYSLRRMAMISSLAMCRVADQMLADAAISDAIRAHGRAWAALYN
jgi:hypothetical protein